MKESKFHRKIYEGEEGIVFLSQYPEIFEDRIFLSAAYFLDLTKTSGYRKTLSVIDRLFDVLVEVGIDEVYCLVHSQSAFNFNERLGFEANDEAIIVDGERSGTEIMRLEL